MQQKSAGFSDGENRIVQGDCMDMVNTVPDTSIDFLLTDPPYSMPATYAVSERTDIRLQKFSDHMIMKFWFDQVLKLWQPKMKPNSYWAIFCNLKSLASFYPSLYEHVRKCYLIAWEKNLGPGNEVRSNMEIILIGVNGKPGRGFKDFTSIVRFKNVPSKDRIHPVEKPVALYEKLIRHFAPEPGMMVVDPFAGSCNVHVAAKMSNRKSLCIEYDDSAINAAMERAGLVRVTE